MVKDCDDEYRFNDSDYVDYSAENYDSKDCRTSDPNETCLFIERCKGTSITFHSYQNMIFEMKRLIKETVEVLSIPPAAAAVLLREHKWSKEVLFEKFFMDPIKLEQKYGVYYRCNPVRVTQNAKTVCEVCYEGGQPMISMPCGHGFCKDCWRDFCEKSVTEGPSCVRKSCPKAKCNEMVTEEEVEQAVPHLLRTFETYELRSFIVSNVFTRWCPGPGCDHIALVSSKSSLEQYGKVAKCTSCRTQFCFLCGKEPHAPCACKEAALWDIKQKTESETLDWVLENTNPCPRCTSRIEENEGCNSMTWQTFMHLLSFTVLGGVEFRHRENIVSRNTCNKNDLSEAEKAKRRYFRYSTRFHALSRAQSLAEKQLTETELKMIKLQESFDGTHLPHVEFLKTANEKLIECWRVLKYSNAFSYYLSDDSKHTQRIHFDMGQLERYAKTLSENCELPLDKMNKMYIINLTRLVDESMTNFLKFVDENRETNYQAP